MRAFMELLGLVSLVAFTSVIISISILSQGALIYYYEPNKFIWITEVLLGICGVIVGIERIKECLPGMYLPGSSGIKPHDDGRVTGTETSDGSAIL
jgi:hypothetical protein